MTADNDQRALQELLPWLANDTLQREEREQAAEYANENLEGRRQLRQWQALAEQMPNELYEQEGEDFAWARLNRALDRQADGQPDPEVDRRAGRERDDPTITTLNTAANRRADRRSASHWAQPITRGQLAASIAAIAAIGLVFSLTLTPQTHPLQSFDTLSTPDTSTLASDEVSLRLALAPSAGLAIGSDELAVFLKVRDATLMSQSAQANIVTIRVHKGSPFSDPARWHQEAAIMFAEQVK